ncbi:MAG: efflux RND transporter permease subunit [Pseudomonadales bacterium]
MQDLGFAGRTANRLIDSPLVPLFVLAALLLGGYGLLVTPREDRPEIDVPTVLVAVPYPGGGAERVDQLVARPVAVWARQLADVVEVWSAASDDAAVLTVEFASGVDESRAFTELTELLAVNAERLPPGAGRPLLQISGDDQLVIQTLTLSSDRLSPYALGRLGEELASRLEQVEGVRSVGVHGGRTRAVQVLPQPQQLAAHGVSFSQVLDAIGASGLRLPADALYGSPVTSVRVGTRLETAQDVARIQVGAGPAGVIYLEDVARIVDGPLHGEDAVLHWRRGDGAAQPGVTLAVTSVPRQNVSDVTRRVGAELEQLLPLLIPEEVVVTAGYDAGRDATERVYSVLRQLLTGTLIVVGIIWLGLGWRAAAVIALMMPASLAIVPYAYYRLGFTLNPVSIAAMILAIGILADDAVIMLENVKRLFREHGERSRELTVKAINEVGNPTILADMLVVATLIPTAFITGEMGQYVRAIPIGTSIAVLFSLLIALTISPYLGYRLLRPGPDREADCDSEEKHTRTTSRAVGGYRRLLQHMLRHAWLRWGFYAALLVLMVAAFALLALRQVEVGLTPLLDREVFVIDVELPPGASLQRTLNATAAVGRALQAEPDISAYTVFAGVEGPLMFPPAILPAALDRRPHQASIHVQLPHEDERRERSYELNRRLAERLPELLAPFVGDGYVRRIPSGPSRERAVSAEIYAPDQSARLALAEQVAPLLRAHRAVVAVETLPAAPAPRIQLTVDQNRAAARGVAPGEVARVVNTALAGATVTSLQTPGARQPVPVLVRLAPEQRRVEDDLAGLYVSSVAGEPVPLRDVVRVHHGDDSPVRYRRDLLPVNVVAADLNRQRAEALTVQVDVREEVARLPSQPQLRWFRPPADDRTTAVYWGGEWETTVQVYRDLGAAGAVVMVLIYVLLAGWFGSYTVPLLIMLPIPLIFIGVIPAHWAWGINLAGTGVLGIIALAGIVARNAILLVDFVEQRRAAGMDIHDAVVEAGALRARPIILTAATVMFGSGVLIFEPALEPLGLTLASGVLVSTLLTLLLIPALYFDCYRR